MQTKLQSELDKDSKTKTQNLDVDNEMALRFSEKMRRFAPPWVPVGPGRMRDIIGIPAEAPESDQMKELNLRADQFQINDRGNLVISNQELIEFFKGLKNSPQAQDIRLRIVKIKPSEEE